MLKNFLFAIIDGQWHLCAMSNFATPTTENTERLMKNAVGYLRHVAMKQVTNREIGEAHLDYYMRVMGSYHYKIVQAETQAQAMRRLGIQEIYII